MEEHTTYVYLMVLAVTGGAAVSILRKRRKALIAKRPSWLVDDHMMSPFEAVTPTTKSAGSLTIRPCNQSRVTMMKETTGHFMGDGYERRLLVAMVGLPARGKSYIVKMLIRYLRWNQIACQVFNVGEYRRKLGMAGVDKSFFDASNPDAADKRERLAAAVLDEAYDWLSAAERDEPRVAFFDATNTTRKRRAKLMERNRAERKEVSLLFVESICDDEDTLQRNYALKLQNNDYKGMDKQAALKDFMGRVKAYEAVYETLEDDEDDGKIHYIKVYNVGQKLVSRHCTGYLPCMISFFLHNIHIKPRKIYLTRHAESVDQSNNILGRDSGDLTEAGRQYCMLLAKFLKNEQERQAPGSSTITVLAGTHQVSMATLEHVQMLFPCVTASLLNELRGGELDGWSRDDIKAKRPDVYEARLQDKLNYRYPGAGESYMDVVHRIRPVIIELERQRSSVMVVTHLAVQRCIYAYFTGTPLDEMPYLQLPHHTVFELEPGPFGCQERRHRLCELDDLM